MTSRETKKSTHHQPATRSHKPFFNAGADRVFFATEKAQPTHFFPATPAVQRMPAFDSEVNPNQAALVQRQAEMGGELPEKEPVQRQAQEEEKPVQTKVVGNQPAEVTSSPTQQPNNTGLPDNLKTSIENLSGISMDDVKVHYNSAKPAQVQALAYTQGTEIHVAPGQEKHLPHEAWHVVQQKQRRVKPTLQAKGLKINNEQQLEQEADVMGASAATSEKTENKVGRYKDREKSTKAIDVRSSSTVLQLILDIDIFLELIQKLKKTPNLNVNEERLFNWYRQGIFDDPEINKQDLLVKMKEFNNISENTADNTMKPGQTHAQETLPSYLNYLSEFTYNLPNNLGVLEFKKRFDRITAHGWISNNVVIPKGKISKEEVAIHVILAVEDVVNGIVTCNPHVTIRKKEVQDKISIIAMLNEQQRKKDEMVKLGKEGTNNSLSIGMRSDRLKEDNDVQEKLGVNAKNLKEIFTEEWLTGVVLTAEKVAKEDKKIIKAKSFHLKSGQSMKEEESSSTEENKERSTKISDKQDEGTKLENPIVLKEKNNGSLNESNNTELPEKEETKKNVDNELKEKGEKLSNGWVI